ncbi:ABC1-domain-containing protein [Sistotremastrum niveocremeum HHB9708]|uniref:ABC1-domain-containing protein n=1 Tax=Sistotremastrum niveocremeum HHB9708 TaxID=1314777 RepID=A0A165A0T8_9AGAM|nr:ABC1-domain-containing protein [Sistotremastrum niveocremeum HHB9708]
MRPFLRQTLRFKHRFTQWRQTRTFFINSVTAIPKRWLFYSGSLVLVPTTGLVAYDNVESVRHTSIAMERSARIGNAAIMSVIDYKRTFAQAYPSKEAEREAISHCHTRSAKRTLRALLKNGGIYIKLGQHVSSLIVIPREWTSVMRVLQDQCEPTPYTDVEQLFLSDTGHSISELFDDFDPVPIGVASLAQVHVGRHKQTGQAVAVKLQHPHLAEFTEVDMKMVEFTLDWVKYFFPEFEFTWLGEEMRENIPKEMNFVVEAGNAAKAVSNFAHTKTSLYIPEVIYASKRVLIMEYIKGGRVDDKEFLLNHNIDRNKVALELQRIFSQMVHLDGWFHADPHPGNLLIRPSPPHSRSPYNFEIVLLDHGLYFDINEELRIDYSKLWLSLIARDSSATRAERRKYAQLVGNIGPELYPVFETAITGRIAMAGTGDDGSQNPDPSSSATQRAQSMLDFLPQTEEELDIIRDTVVNQEGLVESVFELLRKVPRRVLMILKLNDLTRNLDHSLDTTHSKSRIFIITARYCSRAVWEANTSRLWKDTRLSSLVSPTMWRRWSIAWWNYEMIWTGLRVVEIWMDFEASLAKARMWWSGLVQGGFKRAHLAAAGVGHLA